MSNALIKHFNISDNDLAEIQKNLSGNQTLLDALFEKNLLESSAYLAWAKEHYSLPVLKAAFLEKNNNVRALLDRYKNVFPKNIIPFHEMDGVLYVMCLEPTPFDAPQAIQYVLAPYDVISKYAVKNEATAQTPAAEAIVESVLEKENTNPLFKNLEASAPEAQGLEGLSFDTISVGEGDGGPQLEGLNLSPQEAVTMDAMPTPEGEMPEINLEEKKDVPSGLAFPPEPSEDPSYVTDKPVSSVDLDNFKFEGIVPTNDEPAAPAQPAAEPAQAVATPTPEPVAPTKTPTPTATPQPQAISPKPVTAAKPAAANASLNDFVVKPRAKPAASESTAPQGPQTSVPQQKTGAPAANNQFSRTLDSLKKYFQQTMVLVFNNEILEPVAWDETWNRVSHAQAAVDVTTPSIFRIVNESQEPYHGYVVPNPVNDAFFNTWNNGQTPEHITICPILQNKKVCGMVLGITTKEDSKKYQLHHIQQIANEAVAQLPTTKAA